MPKPSRTPLLIQADAVYHTSEVKRRLRISDLHWREIRPKLPIIPMGRQSCIIGSDLIEYLKGERDKAAAEPAKEDIA